MQNENVGPLVQKLLSISQQQLQSIKPSTGPSQCSCSSPGPIILALLQTEPNKKASGSLIFLLNKIWAPLGLLEDKCEMSLFARNGVAGGCPDNVCPALWRSKKESQ